MAASIEGRKLCASRAQRLRTKAGEALTIFNERDGHPLRTPDKAGEAGRVPLSGVAQG